jgi:predicted nucleic-acid-binding Zn-ribbon protein
VMHAKTCAACKRSDMYSMDISGLLLGMLVFRNEYLVKHVIYLSG